MDYCGLQDIFRGMASTGCWICFNNLNHLDPSVLSVFAQLITTVFEALRAGKAAVHLQSDDIQLNPSGACFALLDSAIPVKSTNPDKLLLYPSVTAVLPNYIMRQFRTISIPKPDLKLSLEVMLFSQGLFFFALSSTIFSTVQNKTKQNSRQAKTRFICVDKTNEPHREKTGFLPRRKQRRRSASR